MFSQQDIDRELTAALSVAPSAGFEARVLRRVQEDPARRTLPSHVWIAAAAAVLVTTGVFYAVSRQPALQTTTAPDPIVLQQPAPADARSVQHALAEPSTNVSAEPSAVARRNSRRAAPRRLLVARRAADAEVLVPPEQMLAVRRYLNDVNAGRLARVALPPDVPPITPLTVPPVVIRPHSVPALDAGLDEPAAAAAPR